MSSKWEHLELTKTALVQSLHDIKTAISSVVGILVTIGKTAKNVADLVSALARSLEDANIIALKAAIATVRAMLDDVVGEASCYFLPIPVRLIHAIPKDKIIYALDPSNSQNFWLNTAAAFVPPISGKSGGNYGFMEEIITSLNDENDLMRPMFDSDAHVAGIVVVAGSSTYLNLIPLIKKLAALFSGKTAAGEGFRDNHVPTVKNVRVTVVPKATSGAQKLKNRLTGKGGEVHPYAIRLHWDRTEKIIVNNSLGTPYKFILKKVIILRTENEITTTTSIERLLNDDSVVKTEFDYDGFNAIFYDDTIALNKIYYYAIAYNYDIEVESRRYSSFYSWPLAIVRVSTQAPLKILPRAGIPPDWVMLPSPLGLWPWAMQMIDEIYAFLDTIEKRIDSATDVYKQYSETLWKKIEKYIKWTNEVIKTLEEIVDQLTMPELYIGAFTFKGKGGNALMIEAIGKALQDTTDPNRPPFDRGDEAVTGFVLMAGAESAGKLTAFINLIEMLIGKAETATESTYKAAADSINYLIEETTRQINLLKNLQPGQLTVSEKKSAIGPDLTPAEEQNDGKECTT